MNSTAWLRSEKRGFVYMKKMSDYVIVEVEKIMETLLKTVYEKTIV